MVEHLAFWRRRDNLTTNFKIALPRGMLADSSPTHICVLLTMTEDATTRNNSSEHRMPRTRVQITKITVMTAAIARTHPTSACCQQAAIKPPRSGVRDPVHEPSLILYNRAACGKAILVDLRWEYASLSPGQRQRRSSKEFF